MKLREAETLAAAYRGGALSVKATEAVAVDTTVQEAIAHPTEHGLLLTAIEQLGAQAKKADRVSRQSYVRVARRAAMKPGRYLHAQQGSAPAAGEIRAYDCVVRSATSRRNGVSSGDGRAAKGTAGGGAGRGLAHRAAAARRCGSSSISGTPRKWNASSKAKHARRTSSDAKFPWPPICDPGQGGIPLFDAQALHEIRTTAIPWRAALEIYARPWGVCRNASPSIKDTEGHRITLPHTAVYLTGQRRGVTETINRWLKTPRGRGTGHRSR